MAAVKERVATTCKECGSVMVDEICLNADCTAAQNVATRDAARQTAKATAPGATAAARTAARAASRPRAVNLHGNVD